MGGMAAGVWRYGWESGENDVNYYLFLGWSQYILPKSEKPGNDNASVLFGDK